MPGTPTNIRTTPRKGQDPTAKTEIAKVREELIADPLGLGYSSMTSPQKASKLSETKQVSNPVAVTQTLIPQTGTRLHVLLTRHVDTTRLQAMLGKSLDELRAIVESASNPEAVRSWGEVLKSRGELTEAELNAIMSDYETETEDDPNYSATVSTNRLSEIVSREIGGIADWEIDLVEAS